MYVYLFIYYIHVHGPCWAYAQGQEWKQYYGNCVTPAGVQDVIMSTPGGPTGRCQHTKNVNKPLFVGFVVELPHKSQWFAIFNTLC